MDKSILKFYLPIKEGITTPFKSTTNAVEISLYYSKGGMNYFTGRVETRGYYAAVSPVERKGNMITLTAFSGGKRCVVPVSRQSKSKEAEFIRNAKDAIKDIFNALWDDGTNLVDGDIDILIDKELERI